MNSSVGAGGNNLGHRSYLVPIVKPGRNSVQLVNSLTRRPVTDVNVRHVHDLYRAQVLGPAFPCSLGKVAISKGFYRMGIYDSMQDASCTLGLHHDLLQFVGEQPTIGVSSADYSTFIALFMKPIPVSELSFEDLLWDVLQIMHDEDAKSHSWDGNTSSDPDSPDFSYSIGGKSFFVVGQNVQSSRFSRRFVYPALAFNSHAQFEHLRTIGEFSKFQTIIRNNDTKIQGSINPSLNDYATDSEAKQYSGRLVEKSWKCPFRP